MKNFRAYALRLISIRARSEFELRRRLSEKGASSEQIEEIITSFKEAGLLDDAEFACDFVRSKTIRHWSWFRIEYTLKLEFKIADEIIEKAKKCYDEDEVMEYYIKRFRKRADDYAYIRKYLYSRGFTREFINKVLDALTAQS